MPLRDHSSLHRPLLGLLVTAGLAASSGLALAAGPTTLSGPYQSTIVDWPKGKTGTVNLVASNDARNLISAPIDANGHFTIQLPDPPPTTLQLSTVSTLFLPHSDFNPPEVKCVGQGTATPQSAHYREFHLFASVDGGEPIFLKFRSDTHLPYQVGQGYSALYYFDVPTTLNGNVSCSVVNVRYTGTFPAGWSLPAGKLTATSAQGVDTVSFTPDPVPANVTWHLYNLVSGIGIVLDPLATYTTEQSGFNISRVTPGRPAERAGVKAVDLLVEIDGKDITALSFDQVLAQIRGPANTSVTLGIKRGSETTIRRFKVVRAEFQAP